MYMRTGRKSIAKAEAQTGISLRSTKAKNIHIRGRVSYILRSKIKGNLIVEKEYTVLERV